MCWSIECCCIGSEEVDKAFSEYERYVWRLLTGAVLIFEPGKRLWKGLLGFLRIFWLAGNELGGIDNFSAFERAVAERCAISRDRF